ncbi:unnamed protein product (macronuclear) [Paramecium tetraurelia]|uniref:non-specific serine/threonine protein kinase n=1 Tax=Paramecium tetraurelia TaxID=5888 RepID=A0EBP9_PARTE|nr:uncharacterized protein GSPATT00025450001 [Paramecium tetraurelia]CAK92716.1 unnamed protein product [Paramecium tetraurelia]|eukprot:XP_001460113.1 hypothetical protein (macronuclear) [Paramecium tetraurelia strain d4-2]
MINKTTQFKSLFHSSSTSFWDKCKVEHFSNVSLEGMFQAKLGEQLSKVIVKVKLSYLIIIQGDQQHIANIENAIIYLIRDGCNDVGVRILKGLAQLELYGDVIGLFKVLKKQCIQIDFVLKYKVRKLMANGTFANVFLSENAKTNELFAIKCFDKNQIFKSQKHLQSLEKELKILRLMKHKQVMTLIETFETVSYIFVVQEYLRGGDLHEYITKVGHLSERKVHSVISQLVSGLGFIHSQGVIHRDIKPENIILRNQDNVEDLVISDFGLADFYSFDGNYLYKQCGTPGYAAPEILVGQPYDYKVDVFSLGVLFYTLITGRRPFQGKNTDQIFQMNEKGEINFQNIRIKAEGLHLLKKMLEFRPEHRYSLGMIQSHVWLSRINFQSHLSLQQINVPETTKAGGSTTPRTLMTKTCIGKQVLMTEQNQITERKHQRQHGGRYNYSIGNFTNLQGIIS